MAILSQCDLGQVEFLVNNFFACVDKRMSRWRELW